MTKLRTWLAARFRYHMDGRPTLASARDGQGKRFGLSESLSRSDPAQVRCLPGTTDHFSASLAAQCRELILRPYEISLASRAIASATDTGISSSTARGMSSVAIRRRRSMRICSRTSSTAGATRPGPAPPNCCSAASGRRWSLGVRCRSAARPHQLAGRRSRPLHRQSALVAGASARVGRAGRGATGEVRHRCRASLRSAAGRPGRLSVVFAAG